MSVLYDTIGVDYADLRRPDVRIAAQIHAALGDARTILNVGAGAGSYEPADRSVTAVEPSAIMIAQRPADSTATVVQASAEDLPLEENSFDAAMAVITIHHWKDQPKGCAEMRRVTKGKIVFLTFDPAFQESWLYDYFPQLAGLDDKIMPPLAKFEEWLGPVKISPVPVPHDCTDGFMAAYWRRPAAYLDEKVRASISSFWTIDGVAEGCAKLESEIKDGTWARRNAALLKADALDCGYRLVETV